MIRQRGRATRRRTGSEIGAIGWERRSLLVAWVLLTTLIAAIYAPSLDSPFVFDDYASVVQNHSIVRLWPLVGRDSEAGPLTPGPDSPVAGRPLVNLSLAINYALGGLSPAGYRAFNIVIHLLAAILVFLIVRRMLVLPAFSGRFERMNGRLALAAASLWAVHPLQTEAVVYVSQRTELLVALCYLATIYACLRYWTAATTADRVVWGTIAAIAGLAGMAAKEVMVTAPVAALLLDRTLVSGSIRKALARSWALYAALAAGWLLLWYLNVGNPRGPSAGFARGVPAQVWWFTQARAVFVYLKLALWPAPLAIHYAPRYLPTIGAAWPWVVAALALVAAIVLLLRRRFAAALAGAWMLLILSPTLIVPINTEVLAERRMYLPLAGLILLGVAGAYHLLASDLSKPLRSVVAGAGGLVLIACVASARRVGDYRNDLVLWQSAVSAQPDDPVALYNLGVAHLNAGQLPLAIDRLEASIAHDSAYASAEIDLAVALGQAGRPAESVAHLQRATELAPNDVDAQVDFGVVLSQLGRFAEAVVRFGRAHELAPRDLEILVKLFEAQVNAGQAAGATSTAEQTVALARSLGDNQLADRVEAWLAAQGARTPAGSTREQR